MRSQARPGGPVQIGSSAPLFFLKTPNGVEVSLSALLLEGAVVVEFIRGTWDPNSRLRLKDLAAVSEAFRELKARLTIIVCERPAHVARYLEEHPTPLTVLVDDDRVVARSYGILQRFSLPRWNIARPSTFVVDPCGFVRYVYVAPLQIHAARLEEVLDALRRL
jgi:peroxiredoxin